ncbi:glycosyltransferase [Apibacter muscae]|uniref:glycosyltransferase family 2 protein n=1 Tax=Apibacter muscae TaxID=2509004 RepID=UPI0011AD1151|nr:glycosyltransferase [Apibacter muscae]TWP25141.1 glycosyltransferase [Apibacter muscae]
MNQPLVSVIIVCYNHSAFVIQCLNGLLKQTYNNWELIIADDASRDNSVEIITKWLEENKIVAKTNFHKKNKGLVITLNECIKLVEGDYLKLIAADDVMLPNLLTNLVARFQNLSSEYQMIYANAKYIDEKGNIGDKLLKDTFDFDREKAEEKLFHNNFIIAPTAMVKTQIYSLIGEYNTKFIIEDYDFSLRLSKQYKIDYIPEVLGLYRMHSNNITKKIDMNEEVVRIKMHNDLQGKYSKIISSNILEFYKENRITNKIIQEYKQYKGKNKGLYFFLKYKIPYRLYRLKNKLIYFR